MLSNFFLDRPVFAWVIAIIMMLAGGLAIYNLPISQYPPIAPPSIAIDAFYPGASAETVENSVVQIIEQKMTGFDKLLYMSATSDPSGAGRIAGGGHVQQLVESGHLLLDDLNHAVFDGFGRSSGIKGVNGDRRRRDGRILGDGQIVDSQTARQHHNDGDDPGEDRTVQKEV